MAQLVTPSKDPKFLGRNCFWPWMNDRQGEHGELNRGDLLNSKGVEMPGFIADLSLQMI